MGPFAYPDMYFIIGSNEDLQILDLLFFRKGGVRMGNVRLLKNPVLRNKMAMDVSNPAGNVLEEIADQDMSLQVGGTLTLSSLVCTSITLFSKPIGNGGHVCTLTKECQVMCQ